MRLALSGFQSVNLLRNQFRNDIGNRRLLGFAPPGALGRHHP